MSLGFGLPPDVQTLPGLGLLFAEPLVAAGPGCTGCARSGPAQEGQRQGRGCRQTQAGAQVLGWNQMPTACHVPACQAWGMGLTALADPG